MKRKPPKATRIRRLKKALDKAWSEAVRKRDGKCQMPGCVRVLQKANSLHAHHALYPKSRCIALRWVVAQGISLCYSCHFIDVHRLSTYSILGPLFAKIIERVGEAGMANMALRAKTRWDYTEEELQILLDGLNAN